jgi:AsmA protein
MKKILKTISIIIISILILSLLCIGILVTFVSPNTFKPVLVSQVFKLTGRQLTIDGNLTWTFFPYLGVKTGHMLLSNPADYKQKVFAEMDEAVVGVKFLPLLHGKIESSEVSLTGLKLNLIKNANGIGNWQNMRATKADSSKVVVVSTQDTDTSVVNNNDVLEEQPEKSMSAVQTDISIKKIDVTNAEINWIDEQTKQSVAIHHFELHAKDVSPAQPFDITANFVFVANNPTASGEASMKGHIALNLEKQLYNVDDLKLLIKLHDKEKNVTADIKANVVANMAKKIISLQHFNTRLSNLPDIKESVDITGNMTANLTDQTAKITEFVGRIANLTLNGNVNIVDLNSTPHLQGKLQALPFDLKKLTHAIGKDDSNLQTAKMVAASFDFSSSSVKTASTLQALNMQGRITVDELQAAKLKATNLIIKAQLRNGVLEFTPVTATFYQGGLQSQARINLAAVPLQISFAARLSNVQMEPLLRDLGSEGSKLKLRGAGNIDLQMTTVGTTANEVTRNLNGTSHFNLKNGQLTGINIGNLIDNAYAFLSHQSPPSSGENVTNFGDLTGTAIIRNGVITNNDLLVNSPRFITKGQGTINLVNQQINYELQTNLTNVGANHNDKNMLNLYNIGIPIRIAGNLSNPSISLNTSAIAQQIAKQQIQRVQNQLQDKVKNQIQEKMKGKIPGEAGELLQNLLGGH